MDKLYHVVNEEDHLYLAASNVGLPTPEKGVKILHYNEPFSSTNKHLIIFPQKSFLVFSKLEGVKKFADAILLAYNVALQKAPVNRSEVEKLLVSPRMKPLIESLMDADLYFLQQYPQEELTYADSLSAQEHE